MAQFWMVRAGEGGYLVNSFERQGVVAIGWEGCGDFTPVTSLTAMKERIAPSYPDKSRPAQAASAGQAYKFRNVIQRGDKVVSYDPQQREYLVGIVAGDYEYTPGMVEDYCHVRRVQWIGRVSRDALAPSSRNTLGSVTAIFEPGSDVLRDIDGALAGISPSRDESVQQEGEHQEEFERIRLDILSRAHEFIKDLILRLSPDDMEFLTASLLRAMGYRARVTPKGPDRGRDVVASPDGLGFQAPRIVAEVKHRPRDSMGAPQVRSFLGGLREGDRGLFVSIGGFTREARYEADRASVPVTLVDLDDFASLVVEHYEAFDTDGRALVPLVRIYWPIAR